MNELEEQIKILEDKIAIEEYKKQKELSYENVVAYLQKAIQLKPKPLILTLIQKIVVYDDRLEIFFNYTKENNPDDTSRQDYLLPKCSTCYGMVEINGFCRNPDGAPSARRRACALARTTRDCFSSSFFLPFRRAWFSSASATQKGTLKWVPLHGGVVPSKSEPNSAVISSIVAVFEPSL